MPTPLSLTANWTQRRYGDAVPFYQEIRRDQRTMASVSVTRHFFQYFFASLEYSFIGNRSNADLFTYTKQLYTLNVGVFYK